MIYRRRGVVLGHSSEVASKIAAQQCQTRINEFEPSKVLTPLDFTSALLNRGEKLLLYIATLQGALRYEWIAGAHTPSG